METDELIFLSLACLCLVVALWQLLYPDVAVRITRSFLARLRLENSATGPFLSTGWMRFVSGVAVVISIVALAVVLTK